MNLHFVRLDDWSGKRITTGQLIKKNGAKKNFTVLPNKWHGIEFEYGDKLVCVHGAFLVLTDEGGRSAHFRMFDVYWMPIHEIVLTEDFLNEHRTVHQKIILTGTNQTVCGVVIR